MKRILIIGATSAIATHCARLWVARAPTEFIIVGRSLEKLERLADDLRARGASHVQTRTGDFLDPNDIRRLVDESFADGPVDLALVAHGDLPNQAECESDLARCRQAIEVNGLSLVLFAEAIARVMTTTGRGTVAVIGSVAGDRGRKSNYVYGAAKGLVERYVEGMQHRFAGSPVSVVLLKPGPTETPMTAHLQSSGARLAPVESVAAGCVKAIDDKSTVAYLPGKWRIIMTVIRLMPNAIFHRLNI